MKKEYSILTTGVAAILLFGFIAGCASKKPVRALKRNISPNSQIAVIVDHPNNIKNVILSRFMERNYRVKAINASDLYTLKDVYDISDFKKLAYKSDMAPEGEGKGDLLSFEKSYDNLYKLHVYNYELNKAESIAEMRSKYNVQYLVLLDLKDWQKVSWARAIDLSSYEVIWVENYPAAYDDSLEDIIDHFITSMSGTK